MTKLATTTVGVGGSASVVFSNIPQNYTDLCIKISCQTNRVADEGGLSLQLNSATTGQTYRVLAGAGSNGASSVDTAYEPLWVCRIQGGTAGANVFSNTDLYIPNYAGNKPKVILADSATEKNASIAYITLSSVVQANPAPVTSLTLSGLGGTLQQHSTFTLYGVKNAAKTAGNSIKATGGNIVFDGTYVYHVFPTTGTFTPTQSITADVLVVSGGGGGSQNFGGGGGAGGITPLSSQSLSATGYSVTIGAGGAAGTSGTTISATGTVSTFNGTSPTGGTGSKGGGGGQLPIGGASGNGFAAGASGDYANNNRLHGGSGGGAGAVGSAASSTSPGARGGNGATSAFINQIGTALGFGENVSGTNYIGGGGGGGGASFTGNNGGWGPSFYFGPCDGGYGGGGNAGNGDNGRIHGVAGRINTGSGGGGGAWDNATGVLGLGGAGASGIVIIRYKG
jgi:hypothetical protein